MNVSKSLILVAAIALLPLMAHAQSASIPTCTAANLYLNTDAEDGAFNGMSHSGTLVVIRNLSPDACRLSPVAQITFLDKNGKDLGAKGSLPGARFMHPGPVMLPFVLPAGAEATATLRWVSGPVYAQNRCIDPARLRVAFGPTSLTTAAAGHLCGDTTVGIAFEQGRFATDPVYSGKTLKPSVTK